MALVKRNEVHQDHTWDLGVFYKDVASWKADFSEVEKKAAILPSLQGTLKNSAAALHHALTLTLDISRDVERIYTYPHLLSDTDTANSEHLGYLDQALNLYTRVLSLSSYLTPELLALPEATLHQFLTDPLLVPYKRFILEITRYRPHTLSANEENLLALATEVFGSCEKIFSQLHNADLQFGSVVVDGEERPLTHGTYVPLLKHKNRSVRKQVFEQYYAVFDAHKNGFSSALTGSVKKDIYLAHARKYPSTLDKALFGDNVSRTVYDNLIETVSQNLGPLHRYYDLRKKVLKIDDLHIYDTYVPLIPDVITEHSYETAAQFVVESLQPLGPTYTKVLRDGLTSNRWVDRYENQGKRSGAYSSGCYESPPYILMNYKDDHLTDMFTLAHEAGHSMQSYFSRENQPYQDSSYSIFVAEVASTFNEQLLSHFLQKTYAQDKKMLAYLLNQQIEDIKLTLYRQTMFAEFEKLIYSHAEKNQPLTLDMYRETYSGLLKKYFGPGVVLSHQDSLEFLRIPHFYMSFYVYKYATGISAAIALSQQVLTGSTSEVDRYLHFLGSGCTQQPLQLLQSAGVDMTSPAPIQTALDVFSERVSQLEKLLAN